MFDNHWNTKFNILEINFRLSVDSTFLYNFFYTRSSGGWGK